jgi:membrane-associated phospholipid phosphatase
MSSLITLICRQRLTVALAAFLFVSASTTCAQTNELLRTTDSGADTRLFRRVNDAQSSFKTSLFSVTDNSVAILVVGIPVGCIVYGLAAKDNEVLNTGLLLSASQVLTFGAKYVIKEVVKRPRPYEELVGVHIHDIESADPYSFPSGHSSQAFALATMLTLRYPKAYVYVPAFLWAGMVGYGRVYNGLHYPADVLGGAVLGAGSSILTYALRGTIIDVFDRVTGRTPENESSVVVIPLQNGMAANIHIVF